MTTITTARDSVAEQPPLIRPFRVEIPDAELQDLRERLGRTRWPDEVEGVGWEQGTPPGYVRSLLAGSPSVSDTGGSMPLQQEPTETIRLSGMRGTIARDLLHPASSLLTKPDFWAISLLPYHGTLMFAPRSTRS